MSRLVASIAAGVLGLASLSLACAAAAAAPVFAPLAHSALVTVEGMCTDRTLQLRVRRTSDGQPLTAGVELSVTVDGLSAAATARADGAWAVPLPALPASSPGRLSIVVAHDGVREVLEGQLPTAGGAAAPGGTARAPAGLLARVSALVHKQTAWWVLNVLVVLIAAIAISRRMS